MHGRMLLLAVLAALASPTVARASSTLVATTGTSLGASLAADGTFYVAEAAAGRVVQLGADGVPIRTVATKGETDGYVWQPRDVVTDASGAIYVSDDKRRLQKFSAAGAHLWTFDTGTGHLLDLEPVPGGGVWSLDGERRRILRHSPSDGSVVASFDLTLPNQESAQQMAIGPDGSFVVAIGGGERLDRYSAAGTKLGSVPVSGLGQFPGVSRAPGGWLVYGRTAVLRYDEAWNVLGEFRRFDGEAEVSQAMASPDGMVYVSAWMIDRQQQHLIRIDPARAVLLGARTTGGAVLTGQTVRLDVSGAQGDLTRVVRFDWDVDGDGSFEVIDGGGTRDVAYATAGVKRPKARAVVAEGGTETWEWTYDVKPAPPGGQPGISINGAAQFTNTPNVQVSTVWTPFSSTVLLSNDGGFGGAASVGVLPTLSWRLNPSGPERLPKTVYARFDRTGAQTFQDDIILDQTAPEVVEAEVDAGQAATARAAATRTRIKLEAEDATSGVADVQFAADRARPQAFRRFARRYTLSGAAPRWVRARDAAGNVSAWKAIAGAPADRVAVTVAKRKLPATLRRGMALSFTCAEPCRASVRVTVSAKLVRRYRLGAATIATGAERRSRTAHRLTARFTKTARRRLAKVRSLPATVVVTTTPSGGKPAKTSRSVTLRR